jgi:LmbE family N-acetylglucosaminyl deacetylase
MIFKNKKILIIAPHPDDETLGAGGSIARLSDQGCEVSTLIVSGHLPPLYAKKDYEVTERESKRALSLLGVKHQEFLKIPATLVNQVPTAELNKKIYSFMSKINPQVVFIPFPDRHIDHRIIFDSSVVCCRPTHKNAPNIVLAYETLSETHWNVGGIEPTFNPDFFIDISQYINKKIAALKQYKSQIKNAPSRSPSTAKALAKFRGSQNGFGYAEAFKVVRITV